MIKMYNNNTHPGNISIYFLFLLIVTTSAQYSGLKFLENLYNQCGENTDVVKCLKIQVLKIANRALKLQEIKIYDGVALVQETKGISSRFGVMPQYINLQNLHEDQVDFMLNRVVDEFLSTRHLEFKQSRSLGEAREKKKKINFWPLLAAMAIKSGFMGVAFKGIAVTAGAALLIGKMALALCVIMGLKSLVTGKEEKLNVEVVKHPVHSTSHTYSNSFEDEHYHRSISEEEDMLRRGEEQWDPRE